MLPATTSRTPETIQAYRRILKTLENHLQRRLAMGELVAVEDHNLQLALTWYELQAAVSESTSRQYKAALMQQLRDHPSDRNDDAMQLLNPEMSASELARQDLLDEQRKQRHRHVKRGSQQRAKHLSSADWELLIHELCASTSPLGKVAALWLAVTRLTGLRPCEWEKAERQGLSLHVVNAKATNGRAHGPTRTLHLNAMEPMHLRMVDSLLAVMASVPQSEFSSLYHRVRDLIADAGRRCLSKRSTYPSLYTARHLFAAAAKSTFTKVEVAALMGHGNTMTAAQHYLAARHAKGGKPLQVRASDEDMDAVHHANQPDHELA